MPGSKGPSVDEVRRDFKAHVNMAPGELERRLDGDACKEVGQKRGGGESTGHRAGRRIVEILRTKKADLSDDDVRHMRKVVGYVERHLAQRPDGDVTNTRWRTSLMNWGHDPKQR